MKKSLFAVMAFVLMFSLVLAGCGANQGEQTNTPNQQEGTTGEGQNTEAPKEELDYPKKPITFVVPWAAGGGTDIMSRALADIISKDIGEPIIITNRDGANGTIATSEVAKEKGDGYTIVAQASGVMTAQPTLRDVSYSIDDFKAIVGITYEPIILAVNADSPWNTLEDLLKEKDSGKVLKYGHSGSGSFPHLAQAEFFKQAGIEASDVPFKGGNPAMTALLGGHVDAVAGHPFDLVPQAEAGKIRLLGIFSPERFEDLPDLPTMKEQGFDIDMSVWKMVLVPAETPDEIVAFLEEKFINAIQSEEFQKFLNSNNLAQQLLTGEEVMAKIKSEFEINKQIIEELGLTQQ